jgi:hypothetical protein
MLPEYLATKRRTIQARGARVNHHRLFFLQNVAQFFERFLL